MVIEIHMTREELKLNVLATCIKKIEDYFEYSNESVQDKDFVMECIDDLTAELQIMSNMDTMMDKFGLTPKYVSGDGKC